MHIPKRKPSGGFTLAEIMVVIAIIGILAFVGSTVSFRQATDDEKRDQFVQYLISTVRSEATKSLAGKSLYASGSAYYPTSSEILVGSGQILVEYFSGSTVSATGSSLSKPFFGDSGYSISKVELVPSGTMLSPNGTLTIAFHPGADTSLSFSSGESDTSVDLTLQYAGSSKTVRFDRRTNQTAIQ